MQGISTLPGAQQAPQQPQAPGQAMPFQATPQQQPQTPQAMTGQLQNLPPQQLLQMFANPADKTPKWAVVTAYAKAIEQQRLMEAASGQQAMQQGQMQAQQPPVAAQVMMQQPTQMARHGGIMHGYAGGGAVAFQTGKATLERLPGETEEEYEARRDAFLRGKDVRNLGGVSPIPYYLLPPSKERDELNRLPFDFLKAATAAVGQGWEKFTEGSTIDLQRKQRAEKARAEQDEIMRRLTAPYQSTGREKPNVPTLPTTTPAPVGTEERFKDTRQIPVGGAQRTGAPAAAPAAQTPTGGISDLMGPNIDPYLLSAREAQRLTAEAAMRGAKPTAEQIEARRGLDALMGSVVTERQAEEARRLSQAQKRIEEALERSKRAPLEDITYLGQMLEGMRGSKRFGEALAGAAAGAGRAQTARQEALRKAEERYDMSRNDIAALASLRQQLQIDQAKAVEARASGNARAEQEAMLKVAQSRQQLAEFEAGLADKAEGRRIQRQQLALTASEGAADRASRERLAAVSAVPSEARFLEWLRSNPKNREIYESVQEIKGEENRRLKLYEIYTKNKLTLGDMSFDEFLAGFKSSAGAGAAPPPGAVRVKGP